MGNPFCLQNNQLRSLLQLHKRPRECNGLFNCHFVYNWDVKHTAVFRDMKALMCCQKFTFFRHVICFNKSTHTDKALQSCHLYPMSEASFSDLAATRFCSPYLASQSWDEAVCGGHNQWILPNSAVLSEFKIFRYASGCYGNKEQPNWFF